MSLDEMAYSETTYGAGTRDSDRNRFHAKVQLDLPDDPEDADLIFDDLVGLNEFVRDQYLMRLRETLVSNVAGTRRDRAGTTDPRCRLERCVDLCTAEMEKRALRRCMVASIYRETMSNMINEVRRSTENSILHDSLKSFIESSDESSSRNRNAESENNENDLMLGVSTKGNSDNESTTTTSMESESDSLNNKCIVDNLSSINYEPSFETLLRYFQDSQNHEKRLKKSEEPSDDNILSDHFIHYNDETKTNYVTDVLDELNLPATSSCVLTTDSPGSDVFDDLNFVLNSSFGFPSSALDAEVTEGEITRESTELSTICNSPGFDTFLKFIRGSPEHEQEFSKLEECLKYLGPEIESHGSRQITPEPTRPVLDAHRNVIRMDKIDEIVKSELKSDLIAKMSQFRKQTSELPPELQRSLNARKRTELFGSDHDYELDTLTDEEERIICHRRVVKMVLSFMNPYYISRQINKRLFKDLARTLSKKLLDKSFDPDKDMVEKAVNACFTGNRSIQNAEELYLITTSIMI